MIHTGGEQIQGNETRNVRDWGPRLGENMGGRVGKLDSTSSLRLDKDPRWAREVGNVRIYSCRSSVCWRVIHAPRACAVLGCWRQGVAWQQSPARCLLPCIRALREKENFQLFHFVQPLKMVHFPFAIHNYPHVDSNVPCMPTYGVYISQLIRFAKACDTYPDFFTRHQRLVATLMRQGFKYDLLCRKFKQFYRSHFDLISRYSKSVTQHLREGVDSQV